MVTFESNGKRGIYNFNIPTSINEISESYIADVTSHIKVDANYSLIGLIYCDKISSILLAAKKSTKKSEISVIPVFVKAGKSDSEFINNLKIREKLIISPSDIMIGHHVSAPNNLLTINTFIDLVEGDNKLFNKFIGSSEYGYFIEFKLVPNCNIHGAYEQSNVADFVSPFVTKISEPTYSTIITPNIPNIIV